MGSEWTETTLADVCSDVAYGYTESANDVKVGPHFLRITDIQNGVVDWRTVPYCPITPENHDKYRLEDGDVVVARTGNSTGENFLFRGNADAVFASYLIRFRIDPIKADAAYVWYNLRSASWWNYVAGARTGSAQAGANAKVLGRFPLRLPPLPEQRAIAEVLGSLDDKIELNRRMNRTLESMARAWFKSWFVDFDPVHANAAGIEPDDVPSGWSVRKLADVTDIVSGGTPRKSKAELWNGDVPWVSPKSMDSIHVTNTDQRVTEAAVGNGTKEVAAGAVFVMVRGMGLHDGVRISQARGRMTFNQDVKAIVPRDIDPTLLLFALLHAQPTLHHQVRSSGHGTGVLPTEAISELPILMPPPDVAHTFAERLDTLNELIAVKDAESRTLAALRDALLPKLLSGELSMRDQSSVRESA